jgi:hypothetical protein
MSLVNVSHVTGTMAASAAEQIGLSLAHCDFRMPEASNSWIRVF